MFKIADLLQRTSYLSGNEVVVPPPFSRRVRPSTDWRLTLTKMYHTPLGYKQGKIMTHTDRDKQKLVARIRRIRGQVDAIERSLSTGDDCADVLMLLANVRGGINSLMAEVLEDHIRHHMMTSEKTSMAPTELAEDLIDLVRAYLK
jgi:DNA-binding FrmR family transcriptional regulator